LKKILIFIDWFYPGYKGGGPIKSVHSLVNNLNDELEFYVITSDRDLGDVNKYSNIVFNTWNKYNENVYVYYISPFIPKLWAIASILFKLKPNKIYINSLFSTRFGILPLVYSSLFFDPHKIILAPRGMLHEGAISKRKWRKVFYLEALSVSGLTSNILLHATDQTEWVDINKYFKNYKSVFQIANLSGKIDDQINSFFKERNRLSIIFISRIEQKKNLSFLLKLLCDIKDLKVKMNIFGYPVENSYYRECQILADSLPENITVQWNDAISFEHVKSKLIDHHLFILPTLGENYGHAIIEALSVGRPVLISDQTPWKNLHEYHAGWELPLSDKQAWIKAIEEAASWDQGEFDKHCQGALVYARAHTNVEELVDKYREMFGG